MVRSGDTYMSDMSCCPLKTAVVAGSVWPGKLCPDPRLAQPLYVGQRSHKQRPARNPLSFISCPPLPPVTRWTVASRQMLFCNDIITSPEHHFKTNYNQLKRGKFVNKNLVSSITYTGLRSHDQFSFIKVYNKYQ